MHRYTCETCLGPSKSSSQISKPSERPRQIIQDTTFDGELGGLRVIAPSDNANSVNGLGVEDVYAVEVPNYAVEPLAAADTQNHGGPPSLHVSSSNLH